MVTSVSVGVRDQNGLPSIATESDTGVLNKVA